MEALSLWGAWAFGMVVGWITYRTVRRSKTNGLSDIATVVGAVGGATVTALFPEKTEAFGMYGIGLAVGFFLYFIVSLLIAGKTGQLSAVNEWLGEPPSTQNPGGGPLESIRQ